jgi:hypothetical protein
VTKAAKQASIFFRTSSASAEGVELDALQDEAAVAQLLGLRGVEVVGLEHLQLQRHRQAVLDPALAQPHQHLAALDQTADDQRLQAGEVGEAIGIGGPAELRPQAIGLGRQLRLRRPGPRQQAGADHVADQRSHGLGGVGVVADEVARAVAEPGNRRCDLGICAGAGRDPALGAAAETGALVGASEDRDRLPLPGTTEPCRRRYRADRPVEPVHDITPC